MINIRTWIAREEHTSKFKRLYDLYKNTMFYVAYDIVKNTDDAEDIVNESMMKITYILHKISEESIGTSRCKNLMITIAKNTAIDFLRKSKRQADVIEYEANPVQNKSAEQLYIEMESYSELIHCIDELDDIYKDVLRMKTIHNLNSKEIAEILNISVATVNMRYMRAKQKLYERLNEKGKEREESN